MISKEEYRKTLYYGESILLINDFINDILDGEINRLKAYCFDDLKGNIKYSYPKCKNIGEWVFDCDDTALARAIYCVIWGHIFELKADEIGPYTKAPYRGDTMNSFNTLFGNDKSGLFAYRARFYGLDEDITSWGNIIRFRYQYHTIGNFIILPNIGNINGKRGNFKTFRDYFDLFLLDMYEYKEINKSNSRLKKSFEENPFYREFSMNEIKEFFFLDEYFEDEKPKEFISISKKSRFKYTRSKQDRINMEKNKKRIDYFSEEEYKKLVDEYITKSEEVIANRADKIIEALKKELEESVKIGIL